MNCRARVACAPLKEDGKAATSRFGSDLSSQSMAYPIQHDDNGFRIFRNGFRQVAVLTAAPMLDVSMPAASLLADHLSRIAADNEDTHRSFPPFDKWQQGIPAAILSVHTTHGCD